MKSLLPLVCLLLASPIKADDLEPLRYNHPGLHVDLGVGLWAWPVPCDADGDGDFDLIVSCPDKPSNGVWLFENAQGDTAEHKLPVFQPARRLSATVHYVMPSYIDGRLRVLSPNYEYHDFEHVGLLHRVAVKLPVQNYYRPAWKQPKGPKIRHHQWRYVDYDGDGAVDLVTGIEDWSDYGWDDARDARGKWINGPLHGFVFMHRNLGSTAEPRYAAPEKIEAGGGPIDVFGCLSPNFGDFDGDGDFDLLCGEFLDSFTYFENVGSRRLPRYAAGQRLAQADGSPLAMDLEMIVPVAFDWDKDGDLDLIVGDEDGRVAFIENISARPTSAKADGDGPTHRPPIFAAPHYFQQQADKLKCGALATPNGVDWDGDGDTDLVSGNSAGYIEIFENLSGSGEALPKWAAPRRLLVEDRPFRVMAGPTGSVQGPAEAKWGYTTLNVADWDGDALPDIVFNSILGRVEWLKNLGPRESPRFAKPRPIEVDWPGDAPKPDWAWRRPNGKELVTQWRTTPVVYDFTGDGLADLAMLDVDGYFALFERARGDGALKLLPPRRAFTDSEGKPLRLNDRRAGGSGRRKIAVVDWDGDGELDLLINSSSADLYRSLGRMGGIWRFQRVGPIARRNIEGHDVSPTTVDFDADGVPDFLGGAEDGRFYFLRNPRAAAAARP